VSRHVQVVKTINILEETVAYLFLTYVSNFYHFDMNQCLEDSTERISLCCFHRAFLLK
jgi:hypothetical protein